MGFKVLKGNFLAVGTIIGKSDIYIVDMNIHEAILYAVHKLKFEMNVDVALVVRRDTGTPDGYATDKRQGKPRGFKTAAANLIKGKSEAGQLNAQYDLYTSYPPTKLCIGLGMRCRVVNAYYLNGQGQVRSYQAKRPHDGDKPPDKPKDPLGWLKGANKDISAILVAAAQGNYQGDFATMFEDTIDPRRFEAVKAIRVESEFKVLPMPPLTTHVGKVTEHNVQIYMRCAAAMVGIQNTNKVKGNNIGTIVVNREGKIIAYGINTNDRDNTMHAETNCMVQLDVLTGGDGIPDGAYLFTTLRSCDMCAAVIFTVSGAGVNVRWGEADPGITDTCLSGVNERRANLPLTPQARTRWKMLSSIMPELVEVANGHPHLRQAVVDERERALQQLKNRPKAEKATQAFNDEHDGAAVSRDIALAHQEAVWRPAMQAYQAQNIKNTVGRLTHVAAVAYFQEQLNEPNDISEAEADAALTHCAEFLVWFEKNVTAES